MLSIIVAVSQNGIIGSNNTLPWHLPSDLKYFKQTTMGRPIIYGRRTYESIGRPLPGRTNILITSKKDYAAPGCIIVTNFTDAVSATGDAEEVFVIGGEMVYREALFFADKIYVTIVDTYISGDASFPPIPAEFLLRSETGWEQFEKDEYRTKKVIYERV